MKKTSIIDKETVTVTSTIEKLQKTIEEKRLKLALELHKF
jgi:hypothetical protein